MTTATKPRLAPKSCECDNTHEQNLTVCMPCMRAGFTYETAWWHGVGTDTYRKPNESDKPNNDREQLLARISELESALRELITNGEILATAVKSQSRDTLYRALAAARRALGTNPQPIPENVSQGERIAKEN